MKTEKAHKIVIIGVIIYVIIMLIIFLPGYIRNRTEKLYILSGDFIKIKYENGQWYNITNSDDYKLKEFKVYESGQYKGDYKLMFTNKYHLYDTSGQTVSYNGQLFAYTGSLEMSVIDIENGEITESDKSNIEKVLEEVKVFEYEDLNLFQKASLDVDKDGVIETVYCINNYYAEKIPSKAFSIVFIEKNGKIDIIKEKVISSDKIYQEPSYEINKILDIKNDKNYELMIEQSYFSRPEDSCVQLYRLSGKKSLIKNLCE